MLERAILRATAKQPADRFDSTRRVHGELRAAAREAPDLPVGRRRVIGAGAQTRAATLSPAPAPDADPVNPEMTLSMPAAMLAALQAATVEEQETADDVGATHWVRPAPAGAGVEVQVAGAGTNEPTVDVAALSLPTVGGVAAARRGRMRRATSFNQYQWLAIVTGLVAVVFINAVGLWLTHADWPPATATCSRV